MSKQATQTEPDVYARQGFGAQLGVVGPVGLLIVDFVAGFADPATFGGGNIPEAIGLTRNLLEAARSRRWPVAHTRIVFADDDSDANVFCLKVPGMLGLKEDAPASAIVPELAPVRGELVVRKTNPSAFFDTPLRAWLTQAGVQTLLIAGCTTSGCVRASVVDAMSAGFRPFVVEDCVGDRAIAPHRASLFDMRQKYAAVMPLAEVMQQPGIATQD